MMRNPLDTLISAIAPGWGLRRAHARQVLSHYEAARKDLQRKQRRESRSANASIDGAAKSIREQSRHLEQNHDLARGVLSVLSANIIGAHGVQVEPQPRNVDGSINEDLSRQILAAWSDWTRRPEVTWRHDWACAQRIACRSWIRDGEVLGQIIEGVRPDIQHGTRVPLSIELLEADFLPLDYNDPERRIVQGIEHNGWGRPTGYHVYRGHPGESWTRRASTETRRIPANSMLHVAMRDRLHQARGVPLFASVLARLEDLKDYEESERVAAKIAASMAAFIKKGNADLYVPGMDDEDDEERRIRFPSGMIFDDLRPGEDVGTIDTSRPNSNLETHRKGQLRAVAAGTYCSYSSLAKDYDGTYSSQRQELVESWNIYGALQSEWIGAFVRPIYARFISAALASGEIVIPAGIASESLDDAIYLAPQMPWIDPLKEANAWGKLEQAGHASGPEIVRRRGQNPRDVIEQESRWRQSWRDKDESITADPASVAALKTTETGATNAYPRNRTVGTI